MSKAHENSTLQTSEGDEIGVIEHPVFVELTGFPVGALLSEHVCDMMRYPRAISPWQNNDEIAQDTSDGQCVRDERSSMR